MGASVGERMWWGIAVVAALVGAMLIVGAGVDAVAIAAVGGVAAVMVASDRTGLAPPPPPPAPPVDQGSLDPVLDALAEPVLVVAGGRVGRANLAARQLLGAHIVGEDARVAIRHPAAAARLATAADDAAPVDLVGLGGVDQPWSMTVAAIPGGERVVQLSDRSQGQAAERMRVDFVANASHELRTPLAAILGYVETLRDEAGAHEPTRIRFLSIVDDEARRMQRLIDDLISLSRIEADRYRLPVTVIDMARLVREVAVEVGSLRGAPVVVAAGDAPVAVAGDRIQLSQLLHNLIGNAIKYGRHGATVTVTLAEAVGEVTMTIADEGEGIAPEHLPRLTERFYRVDTGRSRSLGGTGLGLAIVKHVVERHRGRLAIASTVGVGTVVTIVLPAADAAVIKA